MDEKKRTVIDVLSDICISFGTDINAFNLRNPKRSSEQMSLITQAFIHVILTTQCINAAEIAKALDRTPSAISISKRKADILINSSHPYAMNFKKKLYESCEEGKQSLIKIYHE